MSVESRLRTLAASDAALQAIFGTSPFRWFDIQLPRVQISVGACVVVRRISTVRTYEQRGLQDLQQPRLQLDVLAPSTVNSQSDPEAGRVAAEAVIAFLGRINLATQDQFGSPVLTPPNFPCFILNERDTFNPQLEPPTFMRTIDVRCFAVEN